jgi:hypothetical protein
MNEALPEPLTPPDCDLRGLPFMPVDIVRLFDSDLYALSTGDEFKAALSLWGKAFLQVPAGSLPDDDRVLAHLSGAGTRWKKVKAMALRGFVKCFDGRLYHPVVCEKAIEAWSHRIRQRERAAKRWHSHGDATAHATAHPVAMQGTGTVKGEVREEERKKERAECASPSAPPAADRATRLKIDVLPSEWADFIAKERPDLPVDTTWQRFRDHWIAKPGKDGRKLDWFATWRNWCRSERAPTKSLFDPPKPPTIEEAEKWSRA